jgi:hypothetical protein
MRQAGTVTYWFCIGAAALLIFLGFYRFLAEGTPILLLFFCLGIAAVFLLSGIWVLHRALRAGDI